MVICKIRGKKLVAPAGARVLPVPSKHIKPHIIYDGKELKHCFNCNTWRRLSKFKYRKSSFDGLQAFCVSCHGLIDGARYKQVFKKKGVE